MRTRCGAHSVVETLDRLEAGLTQRGIAVFSRIDFSADAARAGLQMRPEQLLIFGNPRAGKPLMQHLPAVGLDLPLKTLAWKDEQGQTWIAYNDPQYLLQRYGLPSRSSRPLWAPAERTLPRGSGAEDCAAREPNSVGARRRPRQSSPVRTLKPKLTLTLAQPPENRTLITLWCTDRRDSLTCAAEAPISAQRFLHSRAAPPGATASPESNRTGELIMLSVLKSILRAAAGRASAADMLERANLRGQAEAIERSQALIEFALDGTILTANENFLRVVGYSLEEVRGKHHRMFVDAAFAASAEYREFWARLARGEFCAGQYRRIGKGAREVWLQATYNPILDPEGKPFKVVKICTDITARKLESADFEGKLRAIDKVQAIIEFDLDGTIRDANENFLRVVGYSLGEIRGKHHRMFVDPAFADSAEYRAFWAKLGRGEHDSGEYRRLAKGAREVWLQAAYTPILDANGRPIKVVKFATDVTERKSLTHQLDELVGRIRHAVGEVTVSARDIADGNASLSQRVEEQAASLEEIAGSMKEMTDTVKRNSRSAADANQLATEARASAERGGSVVTEAVAAMDAISAASRKIAAIIGVIDEIAFQTNLLALNAAVEAARAGEQGRGFAVVASEVRSLAGRSASAAKEIKALIHDSGAKVADGSRLVTQSGEGLRDIVGAVQKVTDIVAEIAAASGEQTSGIEQIARAVTQMNEVTQQNAALVEQASAASESIRQQVDELAAAVGSRERTSNGGEPAGGSAATAYHVPPRPSRPPQKRAAGGGREEWVEF